MHRFTLRFLIVLMVAGIPALAELAPVGVPVPVGSWAQQFRESGVGEFDRLEVRMLTDGVHFVASGFMSLASSGWTSYLSETDPLLPVASGPAVDQLVFDLHFSPDSTSTPLAFEFTAWKTGSLLETANLSWDGSAWTIATSSPNCPRPVPEPGIMATLMLGILGAGAFWRKRSSNPE